MTPFQTIFVSTDGRIRAGWRLLMQLVLSILIYIPLSLVAAQFGGQRTQMVAFGVAVTIAIWLAAVAFDRRPMRDFGLRIDTQWWRDCLAGFLLATMVMSLIVLFQWAMGWIEFTGYGWDRASQRNFVVMLGGYVLAMAVVGFYEELWSRGYQLKNLTEGFYTGSNRNVAGLAAIAISSLVFGFLHIGNPNITLLGIVVIILAGVMFAMSYVMTGQLGFAVGLHFAWNVIQGALYGLPVSGVRFRQSVLQFEASGPELWTGGRFGPEGGILGVIGVLLIMLLTWSLLRRRGLRLAISDELVRPPSSPDTYH